MDYAYKIDLYYLDLVTRQWNNVGTCNVTIFPDKYTRQPKLTVFNSDTMLVCMDINKHGRFKYLTLQSQILFHYLDMEYMIWFVNNHECSDFSSVIQLLISTEHLNARQVIAHDNNARQTFAYAARTDIASTINFDSIKNTTGNGHIVNMQDPNNPYYNNNEKHKGLSGNVDSEGLPEISPALEPFRSCVPDPRTRRGRKFHKYFHRFKLPVIIDTVGDRVRSRGLNVLIFLCSFAFVLYSAFGPLLLQQAKLVDRTEADLSNENGFSKYAGYLSVSLLTYNMAYSTCYYEFTVNPLCISEGWKKQLNCPVSCREYFALVSFGSLGSSDVGGYILNVPYIDQFNQSPYVKGQQSGFIPLGGAVVGPFSGKVIDSYYDAKAVFNHKSTFRISPELAFMPNKFVQVRLFSYDRNLANISIPEATVNITFTDQTFNKNGYYSLPVTAIIPIQRADNFFSGGSVNIYVNFSLPFQYPVPVSALPKELQATINNATEDTAATNIYDVYSTANGVMTLALIITIPLFIGNADLNHWYFTVFSLIASLVVMPRGLIFYLDFQSTAPKSFSFSQILAFVYVCALCMIPLLFAMVLYYIIQAKRTNHQHFYVRNKYYSRLVKRLLWDHGRTAFASKLTQNETDLRRKTQISSKNDSPSKTDLRDPSKLVDEEKFRTLSITMQNRWTNYLHEQTLANPTLIKLNKKSRFRRFIIWIKKTFGTRKKVHAHARFETKKDFFYPQRLLFAAALSLLFVLSLFLFSLWYANMLEMKINEYWVKYLELKTKTARTRDRMNALSYNMLDFARGFGVAGAYFRDTLEAAIETVAPPKCNDGNIQSNPVYASVCNNAFVRLMLFTFPEQNSMDHFIWAFKTSIVCGAIITLVIMCYIWYSVFLLYRSRIMKMRQGIYFIDDPVSFKLSEGAFYIGMQAGHSAFGYLCMCIVFGLIFFMFIHNGARGWLWDSFVDYAGALTILTLVSKFVAACVAKFALIEGNISVVYLRLYLVYDVAFTFIGLASGLLTGFVRFFVLSLYKMCIMCRLDLPPSHREGFSSYDTGYSGYVAMLLIDHYHNNPVLLIFSGLLIDGWKIRKWEMKSDKKARTESQIQRQKEKAEKLARQQNDDSVPVMKLIWKRIKATFTMLNNYNHWQFINKDGVDVFNGANATEQQKRKLKVKIRWWLIFVLNRNPELTRFRKQRINRRWNLLLMSLGLTEHPNQLNDFQLQSAMKKKKKPKNNNSVHFGKDDNDNDDDDHNNNDGHNNNNNANGNGYNFDRPPSPSRKGNGYNSDLETKHSADSNYTNNNNNNTNNTNKSKEPRSSIINALKAGTKKLSLIFTGKKKGGRSLSMDDSVLPNATSPGGTGWNENPAMSVTHNNNNNNKNKSIFNAVNVGETIVEEAKSYQSQEPRSYGLSLPVLSPSNYSANNSNNTNNTGISNAVNHKNNIELQALPDYLQSQLSDMYKQSSEQARQAAITRGNSINIPTVAPTTRAAGSVIVPGSAANKGNMNMFQYQQQLQKSKSGYTGTSSVSSYIATSSNGYTSSKSSVNGYNNNNAAYQQQQQQQHRTSGIYPVQQQARTSGVYQPQQLQVANGSRNSHVYANYNNNHHSQVYPNNNSNNNINNVQVQMEQFAFADNMRRVVSGSASSRTSATNGYKNKTSLSNYNYPNNNNTINNANNNVSQPYNNARASQQFQQQYRSQHNSQQLYPQHYRTSYKY